MITGELVGLRARRESDVAVLHDELYNDVVTRSRADTRAWTPIDVSSAGSPYAITLPSETAIPFSIVELSSSELVGEAIVWDIDRHNRSAHLGMSLLPSFRGRGLGVDALKALCQYGFDAMGLHRLQLETLSDNHGMIAVAEQAGFVREGTLRDSAWVLGAFASDVVFGLLDSEWRAQV